MKNKDCSKCSLFVCAVCTSPNGCYHKKKKINNQTTEEQLLTEPVEINDEKEILLEG